MTATAVAIALAIVVSAVLISAVLWLRRPKPEEAAAGEMRSDVMLLRETTEKSIQTINSQLQAVTSHVQASLASVTQDLGSRLDSINRQVTEQLNQSSNVMNANTAAVSKNIAAVQTTFAGLQRQVGEMTEQARQLSDMSKAVTALEHVLRAPKARGSFGEEQLENLLSLVFSKQQYVLQYRFSSGEVVDAVVVQEEPLACLEQCDAVRVERHRPLVADLLRVRVPGGDDVQDRHLRARHQFEVRLAQRVAQAPDLGAEDFIADQLGAIDRFGRDGVNHFRGHFREQVGRPALRLGQVAAHHADHRGAQHDERDTQRSSCRKPPHPSAPWLAWKTIIDRCLPYRPRDSPIRGEKMGNGGVPPARARDVREVTGTRSALGVAADW